MRARWFVMLSGAALLILAGTLTIDRGSSVLVHDDDGRTVVRAALPDSGRFGVEYVHSYYEVPATEYFAAEQDGSFELVGISSPSEAVLDYYELEGRKETSDDLFRLAPDSPQRFNALSLIGTEKGERTLVVSGERFPLYEEDGPRHVTVRVEKNTPLRGCASCLSAAGKAEADKRRRHRPYKAARPPGGPGGLPLPVGGTPCGEKRSFWRHGRPQR